MTALQALLLGILQGLTEFLPVSSSGHLILLEAWLPLSADPRSLLTFDILLHAATALALLLCYAGTWWRIAASPFTGDRVHRRLLLLLIIATIPGAVAGVFFEETVAGSLRSVESVAFAFLATSALLLIAHRARGSLTTARMTWKHVLPIGLIQAVALIPGISRSGSTISAGQLTGLTRAQALDFSFLMAFPIIVGASLSACADVMSGNVAPLPLATVLTGFLSSFGVSVIAILSLRKFVARHSLAWFTLYLVPLAFFLLAFAV